MSIGAVILAASFSSVADAQDAKPLTGEEIRALYTDNEMTATNAEGRGYVNQAGLRMTFRR